MCYFIAPILECYGCWSSIYVPGLCLTEWRICLPAGDWGGNSWSAAGWKMAPLCLMWCLWRERNDRNFNNQERTLEELKSNFFSLFTWTAAFLAP